MGNIFININKIITRIINKINHELLRAKVKKASWEVGVKKSSENPQIIVSLTSYPRRFNEIELCIKSLCLQKVKPNKIILWLGNDSCEKDVQNLKDKYQKYGVTVRWDKERNLFSHKKYYYAMQEFLNDIIILADDDLIYPYDWIESLLRISREYPNCICARRVHNITWKNDKTPERYSKWIGEAKILIPSHNLLATTGAGTLFPPNCFSSECFNIDVFMNFAKSADDIWLKIMAVKNGRKVVWVPNNMVMPTTVNLNQKEELSNLNCNNGENDLIFCRLLKYYNLTQQDFYD